MAGSKASPKRSYYRKKNFNKAVKQIVQEELKDELEEKYAITEYANTPVNRNIPFGVVLNSSTVGNTGNFYKILPQIDQSQTGEAGRAYNTRVGNEICLKKISLQGMLCHTNSATPVTGYEDSRLAVRVMIVKAKACSDLNLLFNNMPTDALIRFGNQSVTNPSGTAAFGGFALDPWRDINRETFTVKYDKVFFVNSPVIIPGAAGQDPDLGVIPATSRRFKHDIHFGKKGMKLHYSDHSDVEPNNFGWFMIVGYGSNTSTIAPGNGACRFTLSCVSTYTDA